MDAFQRALLQYYDASARELPWRGETDPYRVLVSEVMLQQTRVATVERYYAPWLARFPDLESLADAPEDDVLKAWEGLGYYRRARNLHRAAQAVRERGGGVLPSEAGELRALPGVGEYTAGAVASIAFGAVEPAVDGNVRRVLSRLFDEEAPTAGWLRENARGLVAPLRPGDWNQALMELGATLCAPRSPKCQECPVAEWCAARAAGTEAQRPAPRAKRSVPVGTFLLSVLWNGGRTLVVRRPPTGLLAGLHAFPERALERGPSIESALAGTRLRETAERLGLTAKGLAVELPECEHRFSHLAARYLPWSMEVESVADVPDGVWIGAGPNTGVTLPIAQQKVLQSWRHSRQPEPTEQGAS